MENIRPFQLIVLAIFGVAAIAGIYLFATFGGFGGSKVQVGAVTIWGSLSQDALQPTLDALANADDGYKDVIYIERPAATFSTDLADAIASGTGPDLILITQEQLNTEMNKLQLIPFETIPERTYLDAYVPLFDIFLTSTGTYGIPLVLDPLVLYYNRSLLSSANIASPPASWETVAGLAPTLTTRDNTGTVTRSTIALGDYANIRNARAILSLFLLQAGSPITENTAQGMRSALSGANSFGATPAESAVRFYTEFADPAKSVYSWNRSLPESRSAFLAGDVAFYVGFASELTLLQEGNPNLDFDMARIPQPATATTRTTYGLGYAFAIPKQSANASGAYTVANSIANGDGAATIANTVGMAPARRSLVGSTNGRYAPIYYPEALTARGWLSPAPSVTDGIFSGMISNITSGRQDVSDAVHAADQSLNATLR